MGQAGDLTKSNDNCNFRANVVPTSFLHSFFQWGDRHKVIYAMERKEGGGRGGGKKNKIKYLKKLPHMLHAAGDGSDVTFQR